MQALDQTKFANKHERAAAKKEKEKQSLYGRLYSFVNLIYDRDCHFSLLE